MHQYMKENRSEVGRPRHKKFSGIKRELFALENKSIFNKGLIGFGRVAQRCARRFPINSVHPLKVVRICASSCGDARRCIKGRYTMCFVFRPLRRLLIPLFGSVLPTNRGRRRPSARVSNNSYGAPKENTSRRPKRCRGRWRERHSFGAHRHSRPQ